MISFKQFLKETDDVMPSTDAGRVIFRDCRKFLDEIGFDPENPYSTGLFRGVNLRKNKSFQELKQLSKRDPRDSKKALHLTMNHYFTTTFGHPYRTDVTFAAADYTVAENYGTCYAIFPKGDYTYIWSPKIVDTFNFFDEFGSPEGVYTIMDTLGKDFPGMQKIYDDPDSLDTTSIMWMEAVLEYLKVSKGLYKSSGIEDTTTTTFRRNEVMLNCKEGYYALKMEGPNKTDTYSKLVLDELEDLISA